MKEYRYLIASIICLGTVSMVGCSKNVNSIEEKSEMTMDDEINIEENSITDQGDIQETITENLTVNTKIEIPEKSFATYNTEYKNFDNETIFGIIDQIKEVISQGTQVTLVVGGGNFWRGRSANPAMDRVKADQIGMLATVMNAMYLADSCRQKGVEAVVMTPFPVGTMTQQFSKDLANKLLGEGKVLIFAGGIGHPFFSTDTVTALRASELEADAILFAKAIDGVYDSDPAVNPNAVKFDEIPCKDIVEKNLKVIDIAAANLCYEQKIPVVIFGLAEEKSVIRAANGEKIGTTVTV